MPSMNDQLRRDLAEALDRRGAQLRREVRDANAASEDERRRQSGVVPDSGDIAEARRSGDLRHAETQRDQEELIAIAQARDRMADGSYGERIDCGQASPYSGC